MAAAVRARWLGRAACDLLADHCVAAAARRGLAGHLPCAALLLRNEVVSSTSTMAAAGWCWCLFIMNSSIVVYLAQSGSLDVPEGVLDLARTPGPLAQPSGSRVGAREADSRRGGWRLGAVSRPGRVPLGGASGSSPLPCAPPLPVRPLPRLRASLQPSDSRALGNPIYNPPYEVGAPKRQASPWTSFISDPLRGR